MLARHWPGAQNSQDSWEARLREGFTRQHCPKCGGNIYLERDLSDWYEHCLQCGYTRELQTLVKVGDKANQGSPGQVGGGTQTQ